MRYKYDKRANTKLLFTEVGGGNRKKFIVLDGSQFSTSRPSNIRSMQNTVRSSPTEIYVNRRLHLKF
jgi:hypothetical protein